MFEQVELCDGVSSNWLELMSCLGTGLLQQSQDQDDKAAGIKLQEVVEALLRSNRQALVRQGIQILVSCRAQIMGPRVLRPVVASGMLSHVTGDAVTLSAFRLPNPRLRPRVSASIGLCARAPVQVGLRPAVPAPRPEAARRVEEPGRPSATYYELSLTVLPARVVPLMVELGGREGGITWCVLWVS